MEEISVAVFKPIREAALNLWISETGRDAEAPSVIEGSWECKWQNRAVDDCGFTHVSFFCSSASWACSITDLLTMTNYDEIQLVDEDASKVLYRHFVRLLLVVSEVLDDLVAVRMVGEKMAKQAARSGLSQAEGVTIHQLCSFINQCCKHKFDGYHVCNFDLPIAFEDDPLFVPEEGDVCVASIDFENAKRIVIPKLADIIFVTTHAYATLDGLYQNEDIFRKACERFDFKAGT